MNTPIPRGLIASVLVVGIALAGTAACDDDPVAPSAASQSDAEAKGDDTDGGSETSAATTSGVGVTALVSTREPDDGAPVVEVRFEPTSGSFSSYQAELRFPEATEIAGSETPEAGFHVVNTDPAEEEGRVRVAGFAADGFSAAPRVQLELASGETVEADALELDVEVAGTEVGEEIEQSEIQVRVDAVTPPADSLERTRPPTPSGAPGR